MNISVSLGPLAALIAGILILIVPRLLNYIVALYLIIIGLLGLFGPPPQHGLLCRRADSGPAAGAPHPLASCSSRSFPCSESAPTA